MQRSLDVSRETLERLEDFAAELVRWSRKINLISPSTYADVWSRHVMDSAQAQLYVFPSHHIADLGSGGGLPAIVLAILGREVSPATTFSLLESDVRKATFLREMIRKHDLNAQVIHGRVEASDPQMADVVTARAITALPKLLSFTDRHLAPGGKAILHKGKSWKDEVDIAKKTWSFSLDVHQSTTDNTGVLLEIRGLSRV